MFTIICASNFWGTWRRRFGADVNNVSHESYIKCWVVENPVRNADGSITVVAADADNAVSLVAAERKEDLRQRIVSETLTTIGPQQQHQHC